MFEMPDRDEANAPREEEKPREKVFHLKRNPETFLYELPENEQEEGEIIGLVPPFLSDQLEVMLARAYAHQYRVEVS